MRTDRYWRRHCPHGFLVNDADVVPDKCTYASVYAAGRSHAEQPLPFFVCLNVTAGALAPSTSLSPSRARELAAALIVAADDCDAQPPAVEAQAQMHQEAA